ncbi:MAG: hypothetical protein OJF50_006725 [Nitrospira sp.]|jgi:hypothetical protein|nr:hypothetical protein [Nitrospira sp.]
MAGVGSQLSQPPLSLINMMNGMTQKYYAPMCWRALALSVLSLWPVSTAQAQVVFDATNFAQCVGCSSLSFSHTVAPGSNLAIAVAGLVYEASTSYDSVTGITYNAVPLTQKCNNTTSGTVPHKDSGWWYLAGPSTGANTVTITASGAVSALLGGSISASGVDQSAPMGACATANGSSTTPSVAVTAATGDLVLDGGVIDHVGTLTVGSGQTERWNIIDPNGFVKFFGSTEPGASSVTMDWTNSSGTPNWITTGSSLKQAAAGATVVPLRSLLGVGY